MVRVNSFTERKKIMKFRKRPVVIEAIQLIAYTQGLPPIGDSKGSDLWQWMTKNGAGFWMEQKDTGPAYMVIQTLEGNHRADILDWIIKGVKGEFYPCKPDIFEMTYEKVDEV